MTKTLGTFFGLYDETNDHVIYCKKDRDFFSEGIWCRTLNLPKNHFFFIDEDKGRVLSHPKLTLLTRDLGTWSNDYAGWYLRDMLEVLKQEGKI